MLARTLLTLRLFTVTATEAAARVFRAKGSDSGTDAQALRPKEMFVGSAM